MGNYKKISLKQAMKENDIDIQMANDREKFFYVPANRVTQIIIEQWCTRNGIETSDAFRVVRNGKTGEKSFLCYDVSFDKKSVMTAPTLSPLKQSFRCVARTASTIQCGQTAEQ